MTDVEHAVQNLGQKIFYGLRGPPARRFGGFGLFDWCEEGIRTPAPFSILKGIGFQYGRNISILWLLMLLTNKR